MPSPYPPLPKAGSARTGPLPLHPMMFSDLLDGSFRLLKANLGTIVLVAAVFLIPVNLVAAFFQRDLLGGYGFLEFAQDPSLLEEAADPAASNAPLVGGLIATLATVLVTPFIGGATSMIVAASYLGGELKAGPAMRATGRRFLVLLAVFFLTLLLKLGGLLLCLVGALIPMAFFLVTTPVVMVEEAGPIQAMARSVTLVRPRFWPVMAIGIGSGRPGLVPREHPGHPVLGRGPGRRLPLGMDPGRHRRHPARPDHDAVRVDPGHPGLLRPPDQERGLRPADDRRRAGPRCPVPLT